MWPLASIVTALAVGTICLIALGTFGFCLSYADEIVAGRFKCDGDSRVFDLLMGVLAISGFMRGRS